MKKKLKIFISATAVLFLMGLASYNEYNQKKVEKENVADSSCLSDAKVANVDYAAKTINVDANKQCTDDAFPKVGY
ncbi:hypothetical protein ABEX78_22700 [Priestia megaterium]